MMESLCNILGDENHASSRLPKHPNQQRREMNEKPILSTLGNIVDQNERLEYPRKNSRYMHGSSLGIPVDSLSSTFRGMDSDDDDEENYIQRQTIRPIPKVQVVKQNKKVIGNSLNKQKATSGENVGVWACSSLLTGLSLRESKSFKQTKAQSQPIIPNRTHKLAFNKNISRETKIKSTKGTTRSLKDGLSSFLCQHSETDSGDESIVRTLKHRMTTTIPRKQSTSDLMGSKLRADTQHTKIIRQPVKGEALKKAYAVAGRTYRTHNVNDVVRQPSRRLQIQESDLCIAAFRNDNDSDTSSQQQGNPLSLFQSHLTLSKRPKPKSIAVVNNQSLEPSNEMPTMKMDVANKLGSKRLIFTSPLPKASRQHKRHDRKKTPKVKSESKDNTKESQTNNTKHEPMVDVIIENVEMKNIEYMDDDDTASSLSDDSILVQWPHPSLTSKVMAPLHPMSPLHYPAITHNSNEEQQDGTNHDSSSSTDMPLVGETIDDTLPENQIQILSDSVDRSISPMDTTNHVEPKEHSTCLPIDPMNTSTNDVINVRRSHRSRTVTNRFTIIDSACPPTKKQLAKHCQPKSKSNTEAIGDMTEVNSSHSINKMKPMNCKSDNKDDIISKPSAIDAERPKRNRKKTDFYHNKISSEETCKTRQVVATTVVASAIEMPNVRVYIPNLDVKDDCHPVPDVLIETETTKVAFATLKLGQSQPNKVSKVELRKIAATSATMYDDDDGDGDSWTTEQLEQLRDAQVDVDPTSTSYWMDVATIVQGKSATECQAKWFSMSTGKTPAPKPRNVRTLAPLQLNTIHDDEDDIFQSTPMRGNMFLHSNYYESFNAVNMPQLPTPIFPTSEVDSETFISSLDAFVPQVKPVSKAFLQRMKRNFTKADTNMTTKNKSLNKSYSVKTTKALTEVLHDHDMDINVRLTPGGTLQVKSHVDHDDEDDFWEDEYDADEENEDKVNYC